MSSHGMFFCWPQSILVSRVEPAQSTRTNPLFSTTSCAFGLSRLICSPRSWIPMPRTLVAGSLILRMPPALKAAISTKSINKWVRAITMYFTMTPGLLLRSLSFSCKIAPNQRIRLRMARIEPTMSYSWIKTKHAQLTVRKKNRCPFSSSLKGNSVGASVTGATGAAAIGSCSLGKAVFVVSGAAGADRLPHAAPMGTQGTLH
mmetsp:Transcript_13364/g.23654  ORF Transcript_13364/g.23654 Transcript_13364/m.23654 type:complete len:203 (-) Transcript_13364:80-688(-)